MRHRPRAIAAGILLVALAGSAEPYRDDLPIAAYRLLGGMLAQLGGDAPLGGASKSAELIAPLAKALDQKHGTEIARTLRRAIEAGDREAAWAAAVDLVLLDAQDLVEGIDRDDYTGWSNALVRTRKALLNYGLVAGGVRRQQEALDRRAVAAFGRLVVELHGADMTTPPDTIAALRGSVVAELIALRTALDRGRPGAADGGGGG